VGVASAKPAASRKLVRMDSSKMFWICFRNARAPQQFKSVLSGAVGATRFAAYVTSGWEPVHDPHS
jgi:hypothetical protein